ncbi:ribonuclease P protein component [Candidatus Lariskella endosymbiont of Hedychridium roseum]|uniref:ribonuclease P protein component n=1 Tax=Candidatus Lariskella endosymbiont of Hedychridium roseum TaxID=3077949 RepID=UPI003977882D
MHDCNKVYACQGLFRIVRASDFAILKKNGSKIVSKSFVLLYNVYSSEGFCIRFAPIASKKIGGAVIRNKAKRVIRSMMLEVFRCSYNRFNGMLSLLIIARPALLSRNHATLIKEAKYCINKIMSEAL